MEENFLLILKDAIKRIRSELLIFSVIAIIFLVFFSNYRLWIFLFYAFGSVLYVIFEISKLKRKIKNEEIKPEIIVNPIKRKHLFLLEFYNFGKEDILNFKSKVTWKSETGEQTRELYRFFDETQDPLRESSSECKLIRKGEKKYAGSVPRNSIDGKLIVEVTGIGAESKKEFKKVFTLENEKIKGKENIKVFKSKDSPSDWRA